MKLLKLLPLLALLPMSALAVDFKSPSGNILCQGDYPVAGYVSCLLSEMDNKKPVLPRPKDCPVEWGQDFGLNDRGKAYLNCYGDFPYDIDARVLPYGQSINGKGWSCTSQKTGMRCVNKDGKGFLINRKKQTLF